MSTREISGHLREIYGIDTSADLISTITDAVLDEVAVWQQRPLDAIYPLVRGVVGRSIQSRQTTDAVLQALHMAVWSTAQQNGT